jgi:hypothetical protein
VRIIKFIELAGASRVGHAVGYATHNCSLECGLAGGQTGAKAFKGFKFNSVGSQFKKQLGDLMTALHQVCRVCSG